MTFVGTVTVSGAGSSEMAAFRCDDYAKNPNGTQLTVSGATEARAQAGGTQVRNTGVSTPGS